MMCYMLMEELKFAFDQHKLKLKCETETND